MDPYPTSPFEGQRYGYTPGNPVNYTDPSGMRHARCFMGASRPDSYRPLTYYSVPADYKRVYATAGIDCNAAVDTNSLRLIVCLYWNEGGWQSECGELAKGTRRARASVDIKCPVHGWEKFWTYAWGSGRQHGVFDAYEIDGTRFANSPWSRYIECDWG